MRRHGRSIPANKSMKKTSLSMARSLQELSLILLEKKPHNIQMNVGDNPTLSTLDF